jgi:hypothetical protein
MKANEILEDRQGVTEAVGERPLKVDTRALSQDLRWAKRVWVRLRSKDLFLSQYHTNKVT